jgi:hypothetical protein
MPTEELKKIMPAVAAKFSAIRLLLKNMAPQ